VRLLAAFGSVYDGTAAGLDPLACNLDRAGGEVDVTSLQGDDLTQTQASPEGDNHKSPQMHGHGCGHRLHIVK